MYDNFCSLSFLPILPLSRSAVSGAAGGFEEGSGIQFVMSKPHEGTSIHHLDGRGSMGLSSTMIARRGWWLFLCCLLALLHPPCDAQRKQPNFILLLTDDQDLTLMKGLGMPFIVDMMAREGATLHNFSPTVTRPYAAHLERHY